MAKTCEINVRFHQPPPDLAPFFTTFYRAEFIIEQGRVIDALQPEWGGVRFFRGESPRSRIGDGARINSDIQAQGPTTQPIHFDMAGCTLWGFGLMPLGWATFMEVAADTMANKIFDGHSEPAFARFVPLADRLTHLPDQVEQDFDEIVRYFREDALRRKSGEDRIMAIHEMLLDPELTDVSAMARRAGMSQRTLERACRKVFGFPPKTLLRRQRFMRSLARFMEDPSLGWIGAMDSLYFDQSQFVRDCHAFLEMSPSEYAALDHPVLGAFMRERQRVLGSPVQTLDPPD